MSGVCGISAATGSSATGRERPEADFSNTVRGAALGLLNGPGRIRRRWRLMNAAPCPRNGAIIAVRTFIDAADSVW